MRSAPAEKLLGGEPKSFLVVMRFCLDLFFLSKLPPTNNNFNFSSPASLVGQCCWFEEKKRVKPAQLCSKWVDHCVVNAVQKPCLYGEEIRMKAKVKVSMNSCLIKMHKLCLIYSPLLTQRKIIFPPLTVEVDTSSIFVFPVKNRICGLSEFFWFKR